MRGLALLAPLAASPMLFTAACDGETGDGATGLAVEDFAAAHQQAACEHIVACNFMSDVDTCVATMSRTIRRIHMVRGVAAVTSGALEYDPAAAQACVDAVRAAPCQGSGLFPFSVLDTCDGVFTGRKAEGEACYDAVECEGVAAACEGSCDDQCCAGTCKGGLGFAQLGEPCSDQQPCIEAAFCGVDDVAMAYLCQERIDPGQPCPSQGSCALGYGCDPGSGTCFKQAPPGGTCNPTITADACAHFGEFCSVDEMKCLPFPGIGEPCGTGCARFAFCDSATTMSCVALPQAGEKCLGTVCMGDLACSSDADGDCLALPPVTTCSQ